ncbi:MAG TPA: twin-arginine translocase subunit TatC [Gemmatimonadaceae bacterium]|nr:twin-arginine translocase subunit TatC [Gemmatimonadaceae bacterium]
MARRGTSEMPFLDHLEELRWRILWSLLALVIGVGVAFFLVVKFDALAILQRPIAPFLGGHKLVYTHPSDPFSVSLSASLWLGVAFAFPVIGYNIWAFVAPALYNHEKRVVLPILIGAALLFLAGVALAYFIVVPLTLRFLLNFQVASLDPMITVQEYFSFVISLAVSFGLAFELPIAVVLLTMLGLVTPHFLRKFRRHAAVLCVVLGAFLSPGDAVTSTIAMAGPLYFLFELSIWLSFVIYSRKERRERLEAEAAAAGGAA